MADATLAELLRNAMPYEPRYDPRQPDLPLRYRADIPLTLLLNQLPEGALQEFLRSLHPQLSFEAAAKTPWDVPPEFNLGFSVQKRW